jgi:hypothetical protein
MSLSHSTSIATNGLVFYYDIGNVKKSWIGRPVTNQFALPSNDVNGFSVQNSTFTRIRSGTYAGYTIQPTDYVWRYNISTNDCPYHGNDVTINSGQTATFSFDYYIDPSTTNYSITNYLANFEGVVSGAVGDPTPAIKGVWKRATFSATAGSTGTCRMLLYPGGCGGRLGDSGFILYKNPQVEFDAPGNSPSAFVAGTRSNAQAILDLTGQNTITATSLTYNSDNTFSFNGNNNNYIDGGNNTGVLNISQPTICVWVRRTSYNSSSPMIIRRNDRDAYSLQVGQSNDTIWFKLYHGSSVWTSTPSSTIPLNTWCHFCGVFTGTQLQLYKNGQLVQTANTTSPISYGEASTPQLIIGRDDAVPGRYWHGNIPNVQIYNRALNAAEVLQNYNALAERFFGYQTLTYTTTGGNLTITGNGTPEVSMFKTSGSGAWDNQVYSTEAFTAPCTIEFTKPAGVEDNSLSYAMIGWNTDPTTNASYTSIDHAAYPYAQNTYTVWNNGSAQSGLGTWDTAKRFYIVYDTDGYIRHYNGSKLLYTSSFYGTGNTVYVDSSFSSVSSTFGGFTNVKVCRRAWNGYTYV